jgi:8-oxo-dGTP pyrophosphatase MutT (NUDIX family)
MTQSSKNSGIYGYRVSGLMLNAGKVLLTSDDQVDFWVLPGGGVKPFESSEKAIKREFLEEIGTKINIVRFLWVIENSFIFDETMFHALELCFLVEPEIWTKEIKADEFFGTEDDLIAYGTRYDSIDELKIHYRWFEINNLDKINIKPKIYHQTIKDLPEHPLLLRNLEIKNEVDNEA